MAAVLFTEELMSVFATKIILGSDKRKPCADIFNIVTFQSSSVVLLVAGNDLGYCGFGISIFFEIYCGSLFRRRLSYTVV